MLIGFAADPHLDKRLGRRTDERGINMRSRDMEAGLRHIVDGFIARKVDVAIFAGDLFDNASPSERARQFLAGESARLRAALPDALIVFMRGNHDARQAFTDATAIGTAAFNMPGVVVVDDFAVRQLVHDDVAFTFVPWMRTDEEFLAAVETLEPVANKKNYLVMHCGMADLPEYAELRPGSQTLTRSLIPSDRFDWIFSGHFHGHQVLPKLRWTFIGSPERLSVSEVGQQKGYVTYDTEAGTQKHHPTPTRAWYDLGTLNAKDWDGQRLVAELEQARRSLPDWGEALVRLKVSGIARDVYGALDTIAVNRIKSEAFHADFEFQVDDPVLALDAGDGDADRVLLDDLPGEWTRLVASLADRTPEEKERVLRLGLAALGKANLATALAGEEEAEPAAVA